MISVLMGVHRIDDFVFAAIDSILAQEGVRFELLLVANGKAHRDVAQTVNERYGDDERVRLFESPIGQLAHALNEALSYARYNYIARMDADDIAHPDRLKRQLAFLNLTGNDLVGCAVRLIDEQGSEVGRRVCPRGRAIYRELPFRNCFVHPTVFARKQIFLDAGGYCGGFNSEDYDLWLRLRRRGVKWDNMEDTLLDYRIHGEAAQRRLLGYAETSGLMMREFVLTKNPMWLLASLFAFIKGLFRGR